MSSIFDGYSVSILAIPAYLSLSLLPHALSISVATQGRLGTWDNRNPRSTEMKAQLKQRISANDYSMYERMQACHANGMENLPLFIAAVVLGNMAGPKKDELDTFVTYFMAVRVAHTVAYITTSTLGPTLIRSGLWIAGLSLCIRTIVRAAAAMA